MAAIVASADGAAGAAAGHHFGPTEEEVRQSQYKSLLRERGPMLELNCGGVVHCVYEETLRRVPDTLLANLVDDEAVRAKLPRDEKGRIFFDRHPQAFYEILVRGAARSEHFSLLVRHACTEVAERFEPRRQLDLPFEASLVRAIGDRGSDADHLTATFEREFLYLEIGRAARGAQRKASRCRTATLMLSSRCGGSFRCTLLALGDRENVFPKRLPALTLACRQLQQVGSITHGG